jgi:hypothetical protein
MAPYLYTLEGHRAFKSELPRGNGIAVDTAARLLYDNSFYLLVDRARVLSPARSMYMNTVDTSSFSVQHLTTYLQARICFLVRPQLLTRI